MQKVFFLFTISLLFFSCEKDIDLKVDSSPKVLTVDAQIENDQPPFVVLTKSFSFFSNLSAAALEGSFVHDAEVFVSNGSRIQKLKEYSFPLAPGITSFFYTSDLSNPADAFKGALNTSYNLKIISEGKEYTSATMIPPFNATLDSVWTKPAPNNPDSNKRILFIRVTDPPGRGNYVRYFTKRNSEPFFPGENSVFDDQIIDGTTFDVQLSPGYDKNDPPKSDSNFFVKGDTITMKFADISRPTYTFWSTWEFSFQSIGNPFAQPNKVLGNVSNGALGVFAGYAARFKTVVAK